MNLVVNARDAMPGGGTVTIETNNVSLSEAYVSTRVALQPGEYISMSVTDTIKQSGGDILVYSELGRGTSMRVYLPSAGRDSQVAPDHVSVEKPKHGSGTILVVEDDQNVRRLVRAILEDCGYTVVDTESGDQALQMMEREHLRIDLLVSDMVMPGMDGLQLHQEIPSDSWE